MTLEEFAKWYYETLEAGASAERWAEHFHHDIKHIQEETSRWIEDVQRPLAQLVSAVPLLKGIKSIPGVPVVVWTVPAFHILFFKNHLDEWKAEFLWVSEDYSQADLPVRLLEWLAEEGAGE